MMKFKALLPTLVGLLSIVSCANMKHSTLFLSGSGSDKETYVNVTLGFGETWKSGEELITASYFAGSKAQIADKYILSISKTDPTESSSVVENTIDTATKEDIQNKKEHKIKIDDLNSMFDKTNKDEKKEFWFNFYVDGATPDEDDKFVTSSETYSFDGTTLTVYFGG